jgi:hypothetical protein
VRHRWDIVLCSLRAANLLFWVVTLIFPVTSIFVILICYLSYFLLKILSMRSIISSSIFCLQMQLILIISLKYSRKIFFYKYTTSSGVGKAMFPNFPKSFPSKMRLFLICSGTSTPIPCVDEA